MIREAIGTMGLRIGALAVTFIANILYARILGPHEYGLYAYVIAWQALAAVPASLGLGEYLLREASKAHETDERHRLLAWADRRTAPAALVAAMALITLGWLAPLPTGAATLFTLAALLPLINNLAGLRQSILRASGYILTSQWPSTLLAPTLMLLGILGWWLIERRLNAIVLMASMLAATTIGLLVSQQLQRRLITRKGDGRGILHDIRLSAALPFMWLAALNLINSRIDLIMLGSIKGASDAGIYAVASRGAELVAFVLVAVNMVIAPRVARYHHQGDRALLQRLVSASARRGFLVTLPLAVGLITAGPWLLQTVFGAEYTRGALALSILSCAQLVNIATGSVGLILNMTGHERITARAIGFSAVLNFGLNMLLVPPLGLEGAAVASGLSLIAWNLLLWRAVRRELGLRPSAFGI